MNQLGARKRSFLFARLFILFLLLCLLEGVFCLKVHYFYYLVLWHKKEMPI